MGTLGFPRNAELEEFYINVTRDAGLRVRPDYSAALCRATEKVPQMSIYALGLQLI